MIKIKQTEFGKSGNCLSACVASILELPLTDVPNFCQMFPDWWGNFQDWLYNKNLCAIEVCLKKGCLIGSQGCMCILSGISPRSVGLHCIVARTSFSGFEYVFDPHPDDSFLIGEPTHALFLVPINYK